MITQTTLNVDDLQNMLNQGRPVTVLDIRHAEDWAEWSIPGSINVAAYDALKAKKAGALAGVDLPRDRPVVTVCGAGVVSQVAAEQLRARGFQALSLEGGMKAWSLAWNTAPVPLPGGQIEVVQIRRTGKGCLSYLIGSAGQAAVIDPALAPEVYLALARGRGWTIRYVLETHIHADHLSRAGQLAGQIGAGRYLPAQDRVDYPFEALSDGQILTLGATELKVVHTPGHTGESVCYLLGRQALFTGDTLFTDAVGRPDLEASPAEARVRAQLLYHSLQRLLDLPATTLVLPGHTSRPSPFDGQAITTALAQVKRQVELLHLAEPVFVETILNRLPPTPPNHHRIVQLNETGLFPEEELTNLEAGANRCAVTGKS